MTQESTLPQRIGAGSFATIYVLGSHSHLALKCVADPGRCSELLEEFSTHHTVYSLRSGLIFKVPQPVEYYPSHTKFKADLYLQSDVPMCASSSLHTMQRIWPVPPPMAAKISQEFFPPEYKAYGKSFICRIYFGRTISDRTTPSRFFNANNFPLDTARCITLGLPVDDLVEGMAKMLSRIHFWAGNSRLKLPFSSQEASSRKTLQI